MKIYTEAMEHAIARCTREVLLDKPKKETRWQLYLWHRRWRKREYDLFIDGGTYQTMNWYVLKATLGRIGGFW